MGAIVSQGTQRAECQVNKAKQDEDICDRGEKYADAYHAGRGVARGIRWLEVGLHGEIYDRVDFTKGHIPGQLEGNVSYVLVQPYCMCLVCPYKKKRGMAHLSQRIGSRSKSFQRRRDTWKAIQRIMIAMIERLYSPTETASKANKDIVLEYWLTG
jgi:hypothetical protein